MTSSLQIPQSGSPETQQIIDACFQGNFASLKQLVATRAEQAEAALDDFLGQADQQGDEFLRAHDTALQLVEEAFNYYQECLDAILQAATEGKSEEAKGAGEALALASYRIRSAVVTYEESYLSFGDSRFPLVNLLTNVGQKSRTGEVPPEVWLSTCQRYGQIFAKSLQEIDASSEQGKPGVAERRASVERLVQVFESLKQLTPQDSPDKYDNLLFDVSGCFADMADAFETYHTHVFLTGESSSPRINLIIKVAKGTLEGTYDKSILRVLTTELSDEIQARLKELHRLAETPQESEILNDALADMIDVLESIDDALESLIRVANGDAVEQADIQESLDLLLESADVLGEVNEAVAEYNEKASDTPQAAVPTTSFEIQEGTEADYGEPVVTTVLQELYGKSEDFAAARIEAGVYFEFLDQMENKVNIAEDKLSMIHPPDMPEGLDVEERAMCREFINIAEDALQLLDLGLAECREGLEHLKHFANSEEKEAKDSGLQLYYDGTQKLWLVGKAQKRVEDFITASAQFLPADGASSPIPGSGGGPAAPGSLASRFDI